MSNQGQGLEYEVKVKGASQGAAELIRLGDATGKVGESTGKAAPKAKDLGEALTGFGSRNNQAKDVLEGIDMAARGGSGSLFGMAKAAKNLIEVFTGFTPVGRLVTVLGLVAGAFLALKDTLYPVKKGLDENNTSADRLKDTFGELEKASKTSLDNQLKEVTQLKEGFEELISAADRSRERMDKINDAKTKKALAGIDEAEAVALSKATTDEQRTKIRNNASGKRDTLRDSSALAKLADEQDNARNRVQQSQDALSPLSQKLYSAGVDRDQANNELAQAKDVLISRRAEGLSLDSPVMKELRDSVAIAAKKASLAGDNFEKLSEAVAQQKKVIQREIEKASLTLEVAPIEAQTLQSGRRARDLTKSNGSLEDLKKKAEGLGEKATSAAASGDFAAQAEAVAELKSVNAQIAQQKAPPPITPELQQLGTAFGGYHQANLQAQQANANAVSMLSTNVATLTAQIRQIAEQVSLQAQQSKNRE